MVLLQFQAPYILAYRKDMFHVKNGVQTNCGSTV